MKFPQIALIVILSFAVAFITGRYISPNHETINSTTKETTYDRVLRTGTIRCGYGIWAPGLIKDPQTGKLSGIFYDYLEAIGRHTGLKIEWTEEIGWGDYPAALDSRRIDAMCFGAWPKANLAKQILFSKPVYFLPINAYVRMGDTRFDHSPEKINEQEVIISTMDGELSSELARTLFPHAKTLSVPQLSNASTLLLNVASKKADVTFTDAWTAEAFMEKNPGQLQPVTLDNPLRLFGHTIPVAQGEFGLVSMLNVASDEIVNSGEFAEIVKKYVSKPGILLLPKPIYQ